MACDAKGTTRGNEVGQAVMRVVQILESFAWGDAIGNHVQALDGLFASKGLEHAVYANYVDARVANVGLPIADYDPSADDLIVYHLSTGSDLNYKVAEYPGRLVVNYHNVTPAHFFAGYNARAQESCKEGRAGMSYLASHVDAAIAVSDYNARELRQAHYDCPVQVVPILLDLSHLGPAGRLRTVGDRAHEDAGTRLLFVGRVAPNKRLERVIEDFSYVRRVVDQRATLTFVGNAGGMEAYLLRLKKYVSAMRLPGVRFAGHVSLDGLIELYRTSDVFLCESAHEGFCVPLVEAMHFGLPIVAQNTSAVGDTLGDGGLLLTQDDPREAALAVDVLMRSDELRDRMREGQQTQLRRFDPTVVAHSYLDALGLL